MSSSREIIRIIPQLEDYASAQGAPNPEYELIDCGLGHSPFGYPEEVNNVLSEVTEQSLAQYNGADAFSKSLGEPVKERFNLKKNTEVFFNGAGSYGMLASVLNDFVSPEAVRKGLKIVGFGPQFTNIDMLANRAGIPYEPIQPDIYASQTSKLEALIESRRKSNKSAIVYIDNPNNPTGNANSIKEIESLAKATAKQDLLIIDEAYGDLIPDNESAIPLTQKYGNLIVIRSLSKGIGLASPRLGYAVMSEDIAKEYKKIELVFNVDTFTAMLARIALNPDILAEFLSDVRNKTARIKTQLIDGLENMGVEVFKTVPTVSILLAKGPDDFYKKLLNKGVNTEDGATFKPTHRGMNGSMVRMRIPGSLDLVDEIHERVFDIQKGK